MNTQEFYEFILENFPQAKNYTDYSYKVNTCGFGVSWLRSGASGGSCWGDEAESMEPEYEPDFPFLDDILNAWTNWDEDQKYEAKSVLLHEADENDEGYDYYGNYRNMSIKYFTVEELYNYLQERNILDHLLFL